MADDHHAIKGRIAPSWKCYPPPREIPTLPVIQPAEAVAALLNQEWSHRVVHDRHIQNLRNVVAGVMGSVSRPHDVDVLNFIGVVIENADLTELDIPFRLHFTGCFFLDGLHLNESSVPGISLHGYVRDAVSLVNVRGCPIVNLGGLQVDTIWTYGTELDCLDIQSCAVGQLVLAEGNVKRHISIRDDSVILDAFDIQNVALGEYILCWHSKFGARWMRLRGLRCHGRIEFSECTFQGEASH